MIDVQIDPRSVQEIEELRRRHQRTAQELITSGDTAVTRMLAFVTTKLGDRWEADAPRLTDALAGATREDIFDDTGKVFIDPTVQNPVFGGYPAVYGPAVHSRNMWVGRIMAQDAPGILVEGGERFFDEIGAIYT